jgi:beta-glucosidase
VQELKGFRRIFLRPGETATLEFQLTAEDLKFYNGEFEFVSEPGLFQLAIGTNCLDVQTQQFEFRC